jgi:hypothetical protein
MYIEPWLAWLSAGVHAELGGTSPEIVPRGMPACENRTSAPVVRDTVQIAPSSRTTADAEADPLDAPNVAVQIVAPVLGFKL